MWIHYASDKFELDKKRQYEQEVGNKPKGLWFSPHDVPDNWRLYCEENWEEGLAPEMYEVVFNTGEQQPRFLYITSPQELIAFNDKYKCNVAPGSEKIPFFWENQIDWPTVCKAYDGLVIVPYIHELRLAMSWYYGFDCACGVIWNAACIQELKHIHTGVRRRSSSNLLELLRQATQS